VIEDGRGVVDRAGDRPIRIGCRVAIAGPAGADVAEAAVGDGADHRLEWQPGSGRAVVKDERGAVVRTFDPDVESSTVGQCEGGRWHRHQRRTSTDDCKTSGSYDSRAQRALGGRGR
jgi:hypothetical protein